MGCSGPPKAGYSRSPDVVTSPLWTPVHGAKRASPANANNRSNDHELVESALTGAPPRFVYQDICGMRQAAELAVKINAVCLLYFGSGV